MAAGPHPSAAGIIDLYRRHAADWIARRGHAPSLEAAWLDAFRRCIPRQYPEVLDLGCGSGLPIAKALMELDCSVTGVDTSEPLLDFARANLSAGRWIQADMRGLDLGRRFDGLIAWHSFLHLSPEDQRAMFPVFSRHVRPGGALMFTSGSEAEEVIGEWQGEALYHGSLSPDEYQDRLDAAGFDLRAHILGDPACGNTTIWLAQKRANPDR